MQGEERRKFIRVFLPAGQVRLMCGPLLALVGKIIDISVGGIKFQSESEFDEGDVLELEISLPSGLKLCCHAEIVCVQDTKSGGNNMVYMSRFTRIAENDRAKLGDFIQKIKAEQDDILWKKLGE
ncbi:MAG: hypothetical protein A2219_04630 [Elusimicrobia bacterium RIFOXYA2_FULL_50_26]|nr:MAG: hypothetical protein A2219_04630 [Elusimicrobia bacterium RIFOXYA2_FULL_50_26]OGS23697.1 MAG: hypothetical protein A2314_01180 [Elusimicrobia bacterium RIFOXYB2_FULL_50_12]